MNACFIRNSFFVIVLTMLFSCTNNKSQKAFDLQEGDLLFQDLDGSSLSDAIEDVTAEDKAMSFSHVGIAIKEGTKALMVLEAIGEAVQITVLDSFLMRSVNLQRKPKVRVARLKAQHRNRIKGALAYGQSLIGLPYDYIYLMSDSSYYCSELIYEMFKHSGDGSELFSLNPMTFKDAETGDFHPVWVDYYKNLGVEIPEGQLGCNPNGMSESSCIDWVFDYSK